MSPHKKVMLVDVAEAMVRGIIAECPKDRQQARALELSGTFKAMSDAISTTLDGCATDDSATVESKKASVKILSAVSLEMLRLSYLIYVT